MLLADVVVAGLAIAAAVAVLFGALGAAAAVGFIRASLRSRGAWNVTVGCLATLGLVVSLVLLWWGVSFWLPFIFR
jgi:hypothetical protein